MSDIDFFAILKRELTSSEIIKLKEIHKEMNRNFRYTVFDGTYATKENVLNLNESIIPSLRIDSGKLIYDKFDKNSIDAFQLMKYGIPVIMSKSTPNLNFKINWDTLSLNLIENLNTYWLGWVNGCKKFPTVKYFGSYSSIQMIEWGVLGVSRIYYTLKEKDIISKVGAGEYALKNVPSTWHKILDESMRLRKGSSSRYYTSIFDKRHDTLDYIEYIILECNELMQKMTV